MRNFCREVQESYPAQACAAFYAGFRERGLEYSLENTVALRGNLITLQRFFPSISPFLLRKIDHIRRELRDTRAKINKHRENGYDIMTRIGYSCNPPLLRATRRE